MINDSLGSNAHFFDSQNKKIPHTSKPHFNYQRLREIKNITGFVVNVHDATNFDIDFDINDELRKKYRDVITNEYSFYTLASDFSIDNTFSTVGSAFRCRLRGIGINNVSSSEYLWKSNKISVDIKKLIDRADGWVVCTLSDIDVYRRLLVDISILTPDGPIDLKHFILNRMLDDDNPLYCLYHTKK